MASDTSAAVAANIRAEIARRRLSQREIAVGLGVSQAYVSRRLRGSAPFTVDDLAAVARLLELSVADLLPAA